MVYFSGFTIIVVSILAFCGIASTAATGVWKRERVTLPVNTTKDKVKYKDANTFHGELKQLLAKQRQAEPLFLVRREGKAMAGFVRDIIIEKFYSIDHFEKSIAYFCGETENGKEGALAAIASKEEFDNVMIVLTGLPDGNLQDSPDFKKANQDYLDVLLEAKEAQIKFVFVTDGIEDSSPKISEWKDMLGHDIILIKYENTRDIVKKCGAVVEAIKGFSNGGPIELQHRTMMNIINEAGYESNILTFSLDTPYGLDANTGFYLDIPEEYRASSSPFFHRRYKPVQYIFFMIVAKSMYYNLDLHYLGCRFYLWSSVFGREDFYGVAENVEVNPVPDPYKPKIQKPVKHDPASNKDTNKKYKRIQEEDYKLKLPIETRSYVKLYRLVGRVN